jgi:hypothetical protein
MTAARRFAAPLIGLLAVGVVAALIGYATADSASSSPAPLTATEAESNVPRGIIREVTGDRLTLTTGESLQLTPNASIEALLPTTRDQVRPGDWLNAGAVPHDRSVFVITGLVVIPPGRLAPR